MNDGLENLLTDAFAAERAEDLATFDKIEFDPAFPAVPPVPKHAPRKISFAIVIAAAFALLSTAVCAGWYEMHMQSQSGELRIWMSDGDTERTFGNLEFQYLPSNFSVRESSDFDGTIDIPEPAMLYEISTDKHTAKLAYLKSNIHILIKTENAGAYTSNNLADAITLYTSAADLSLDALQHSGYPCWPASGGSGYFILVSNTFGSSSDAGELLKVLRGISDGEAPSPKLTIYTQNGCTFLAAENIGNQESALVKFAFGNLPKECTVVWSESDSEGIGDGKYACEVRRGKESFTVIQFPLSHVTQIMGNDAKRSTQDAAEKIKEQFYLADSSDLDVEKMKEHTVICWPSDTCYYVVLNSTWTDFAAMKAILQSIHT